MSSRFFSTLSTWQLIFYTTVNICSLFSKKLRNYSSTIDEVAYTNSRNKYFLKMSSTEEAGSFPLPLIPFTKALQRKVDPTLTSELQCEQKRSMRMARLLDRDKEVTRIKTMNIKRTKMNDSETEKIGAQ